MLNGTNILISEDFPKKVLEKREQLVKFAKEVRRDICIRCCIGTNIIVDCNLLAPHSLLGTEEKARHSPDPAV